MFTSQTMLPGMFHLRPCNEFDALDDRLLADIGVERHGDVFVHKGRVVAKARSNGHRDFIAFLANALSGNGSAWNAHA